MRVEAVSIGLAVASLVGSFDLLAPLLARAINLLKEHASHLKDVNTDQIASLAASALASVAFFFIPKADRRGIALYLFARFAQCGYNYLKKHNLWHFWGSSWNYGDSLLFILSSAQVRHLVSIQMTSLPRTSHVKSSL